MYRRVIVLSVLLLASCSRGLGHLPPAQLTATARVIVFSDGFHSGVILDRQPLPLSLNPDVPGVANVRTLRSFHFGEER